MTANLMATTDGEPSPATAAMPEGWLTDAEAACLAEFAAGQVVLEIGSYLGRSTVCMARVARYVVSIDPRDSRGTATPHRNTLMPFIKNLYDAEVLGKVAIHVGTTFTVGPHLPVGLFTRVFVDGAHDQQSVEYDLRTAARLLAPGGLVACHDYRAFPGEHDGRFDRGVSLAVDDALADGWFQVARAGTVIVLEPPRFAPTERGVLEIEPRTEFTGARP